MSNVSWHFRGLDRYALKYFQWMQLRIQSGYCDSDMTNDREGYIKFCQEIGAIPDWMEKPSVGRINHKLGYVKGNSNGRNGSKIAATSTRKKFRLAAKQLRGECGAIPQPALICGADCAAQRSANSNQT